MKVSKSFPYHPRTQLQLYTTVSPSHTKLSWLSSSSMSRFIFPSIHATDVKTRISFPVSCTHALPARVAASHTSLTLQPSRSPPRAVRQPHSDPATRILASGVAGLLLLLRTHIISTTSMCTTNTHCHSHHYHSHHYRYHLTPPIIITPIITASTTTTTPTLIQP